MKNGIVICEFNSFRETIKRKKKGGQRIKICYFPENGNSLFEFI